MKTAVPTPAAVASIVIRLASITLAGWLGGVASAQTPGTGAIEGRVADGRRGGYLENARLTIEGAQQEVFTDATGHYRLANVAAGTVRVRVFFTGMAVVTEAVTVTAGQTARLDVTLAGTGRPGGDTAIKLQEFVVAASREMDGAAIAINEQRFAVDNRVVVDAHEFGPKGEGEVGEVLQFLPGISIRTVTGNAYDITLDGVPSDYVPVRVNGFDIASARETTSRIVVLQAAPTTHSLARIEVLNSPTPESPGAALAGSINMVPASAFDRARPKLDARVYVVMRDDERDVRKVPGPGSNSIRRVNPGFNFSYIAPVNDRFGFTLSGGAARQYLRVESLGNTWAGAGAATNGTTLPDTTPERPYLSAYNTGLRHKDSFRWSFGATLDYKLGPRDRLSLSLQFVSNTQEIHQRTLTFNTAGVAPAGLSPFSSTGNRGAGNITMVTGGRTVDDPGFTPTLTYRHDGPTWKMDAGLGHSRSTDAVQNLSRGTFFQATARRPGVTVSFGDNTETRPGTITVTDGATGAPVDPYNLNNYYLVNGTGHALDPQRRNKVEARQQSAFVNARRDFATRVPLALKAGLDVRQHVRDLRNGGQTTFTHVGADGRASTAFGGGDDNAGVMLDTMNSRTPVGFGFPAVPWLDPVKFHAHYRANPAYFTIDRAAEYRAVANQSKRSEEIVSAGFLRGDLALLGRRLKLVGGVRAEQTNIKAEGPLSDVTRNYQRDARGNILRGPTGAILPITTDPLAAARLTLIERGSRASKEYLRWFPSLNASFAARENLIARLAYSQSVGRPNFNQYSGGITLPDTEAPNPATQRITVNNAGIKAWSARTAKVRLEYYFGQVGLVSVGAFRRQFENFFGTTVFPATPEFLALYGLPPDVFGQYDVSTQHNIPGTVRMDGYDVSYKQALTFLPSWARGVQVFANHSALRTVGDVNANFQGFVPRIFSYGVSLSRERFGAKLNFNHRARNRRLPVTGRSVGADVFRWEPATFTYNTSAEFRLTRRYTLFANINSPVITDVEITGPSTPAHARLLSRESYGGMWTFGVTGGF